MRPLLTVSGPIRLYLAQFEVAGDKSLAYLVYSNAYGVARYALPDILGRLTSVGCTVPILVPLTGVLDGPAAGLATTAYAWSYDLDTAIYLVTVGLMYTDHPMERS